MKRILLLTLLCCFTLAPQMAAASAESEFALFKRTISPTYKWGENGVLTIPKADPVGQYNLYLGANVQDAGKIEGKRLYLTNTSLMAGSSTDVEIGYTRRDLIWDDLKRTDVSMDTFHMKARIFDMANNFIPKVALGVNAASLTGNQFSNTGNILFNPYLTASVNLPIFDADYALFSATGVVESLYNEGASSKPFYSVGADLRLFNMLYLVTEMQGINNQNDRQVINAGAKLKYGWVSLGLGGFNLATKKTESGGNKLDSSNSYWIASVTLDIPFGDLYRAKSGNKEGTK